MAITNFNTSNQTFRKLIGNGLVYRVPMFQRDYSWTDEEWEDLWLDIRALTEPAGESGHYMGYLVLQSADDRVFDIIDGQQRITTLSLLVLAILKNLQELVQGGVDPERNKQREELLRQTYLGYLDPVTLISRSKLTLNRNNNGFYQNYLLPLGPLPRRNLRASEHQLRKGFEWYCDRIREAFRDRKSGEELAGFVDTIADKLFFTVISVTDELNAYKVFETLNARGVRLSSTDLLKNFLFAVTHRDGGIETELKRLEDLWEELSGKLGAESLPGFLRVYWNSKYPLVRHSELFKSVRNRVSSMGDAFELVSAMLADSEFYAALSEPADSYWSREQADQIASLKLFGIRQLDPLLLAAHRAFGSGAEFTRLLASCTIMSFRYNVICGLPPNDQERLFNSVAQRISSGQYSGARDIILALRPAYPDDAQFRSAFCQKQLKTTTPRNRGVVRYILFRIEEHLGTKGLDITSDSFGIEHILPENPESGWDMFSDDQVENLRFRIGNLTLLETKANRALSNKPYSEKREAYRASSFRVTKNLPEHHAEWMPERIDSRQRWLADQALAVWRVPELSQSL